MEEVFSLLLDKIETMSQEIRYLKNTQNNNFGDYEERNMAPNGEESKIEEKMTNYNELKNENFNNEYKIVENYIENFEENNTEIKQEKMEKKIEKKLYSYTNLNSENWYGYDFIEYKNEIYSIGYQGLYKIKFQNNSIKYESISKDNWSSYCFGILDDSVMVFGRGGIYSIDLLNGRYKHLKSGMWQNYEVHTKDYHCPATYYVNYKNNLYAISASIYEIKKNGEYIKLTTNTVFGNLIFKTRMGILLPFFIKRKIILFGKRWIVFD
jgi:hypothetical protein